MSDEQQQPQQQPKSSKDNPATNTQPPARKMNIHEMRNQDFVSRLMAATPPYLYSAPVGPNNFFFSDMLRSLVQARNNENARNLQLQQSIITRRPRKRSWSQHRPYYEHLRERKEVEEKQLINTTNMAPGAGAEKPLELTNKPSFYANANKYRKVEESTKNTGAKLVPTKSPNFEQSPAPTIATENLSGGAADSVLDTPPAASLPPQDLVLPPPPPVWYPPLYPPYGIDPLHFFIDLRVSGHIYDRKKENLSPLANAEQNNGNTEAETVTNGISLPNKHRHGSAFTVPVPRANEIKALAPNTDAINLSSSTTAVNKFDNYAKYYDLGDAKENHPISKSNANYMLQQLPRLYSQFAARDLIASHAASADGSGGNSCDADNKSEPDCDGDSDGCGSADICTDSVGNRERDIDVEIIDSIKYRTDGESSRCTSPDEASITQID